MTFSKPSLYSAVLGLLIASPLMAENGVDYWIYPHAQNTRLLNPVSGNGLDPINLELYGPVAYGVGINRLAVISAAGNEDGRAQFRLIVLEGASGRQILRRNLEASVMTTLGGIADLMVFSPDGQALYLLAYERGDSYRDPAVFFIHEVNVGTGEIRRTRIPKTIHVPRLVMFKEGTVGIYQYGMDIVLTYSPETQQFNETIPGGFAITSNTTDHAASNSRADTRYVYLPGAGLIWYSEVGRFQRVADEALKVESTKVHAPNRSFVDLHAVMLEGREPVLVYGECGDEDCTSIAAVVTLDAKDFAELSRVVLPSPAWQLTVAGNGKTFYFIDLNQKKVIHYGDGRYRVFAELPPAIDPRSVVLIRVPLQ